ncbi:MAG TPA: hypothetical protein VJS92_00015, partial [Candidatus Polarisedimenticolaceae bacterium]|nr:hypothetical protein [Candidatus Polarisedimenticolaceae bacterium]
RCLLRRPRKLDLGRVVMLGPPNGGSELIDAIGRVPLLRRLAGRTRMQLGTGADGVPAGLGPVDFELGVIAGTRRLNLPLALLIPGPNDGIVAVARTRVDGMSDFLEVPHTHTFMMRSREVIRQTLLFLERGRFDHGTASLSP